MPYEIVIGDISNLSFHVDVIVTLAHPTPGEVGYGVDRAIYRRTGDQLKEDRRRMGPFVRGGMIMTSSYGLNADRLIHVLVPFYQNGEQGEQKALRKCYDQVLTMAYDHKYRSIAFPLMSSGNYGFPIRDAYRIAMHAFHEFCETHDMDVYLIIFGDATIGYCNKQRMNIQVDTPLATLAQREKEEYPRSREETYRLVRQSNEQHTQTAERIDDIFRKTADQDIFEVLYELMVETTKRLNCSERSICESVNLSPGDFSTHICVTPPEVLAHSMGADVAEIWADFEIPDPYILCFAFLYLLEIGDDMPWVYSVSLPLMEMCASVLPWGNEQLNKDDDARLDHYLEDTELAEAPGPDEWYAMNYENVDEMDMGCRYSCNLAQLVYRTTEGILPRYTEVVWENPNVHELFGETALRDLNPYTYWMRMIEFNRDENPVFRFASPEEKTIMEEKAEMEHQESLNRQEFLSLRTLVLSLQDGSYEDNVMEEDLCFPCELQKNIAVLGGDEAWVEEIDTLVKSLAFIGEAEDVDPEMICEFDAIWVQINGMSHGDYFKITDLAHDYEIPVMYFSYADAAKCAEQLAFYDMEE